MGGLMFEYVFGILVGSVTTYICLRVKLKQSDNKFEELQQDEERIV